MSFDRHLFSATIQSRLLEKGLSVREAANATGISASTISRLANGEAPDIDSFAALALWLEVDSNQFFHTPYPTEIKRDVWMSLYLTLLDLELPTALIEAVVTILRLASSKKGN